MWMMICGSHHRPDIGPLSSVAAAQNLHLPIYLVAVYSVRPLELLAPLPCQLDL